MVYPLLQSSAWRYSHWTSCHGKTQHMDIWIGSTHHLRFQWKDHAQPLHGLIISFGFLCNGKPLDRRGLCGLRRPTLWSNVMFQVVFGSLGPVGTIDMFYHLVCRDVGRTQKDWTYHSNGSMWGWKWLDGHWVWEWVIDWDERSKCIWATGWVSSVSEEIAVRFLHVLSNACIHIRTSWFPRLNLILT